MKVLNLDLWYLVGGGDGKIKVSYTTWFLLQSGNLWCCLIS